MSPAPAGSGGDGYPHRKSLLDVALPVAVVGEKQQKNMGSLRLGDVLSEQTGLSLVADQGQDIQPQGLNSECTRILVAGEPLISRTAGTLDLTRVVVGNIQLVEVGSKACARF